MSNEYNVNELVDELIKILGGKPKPIDEEFSFAMENITRWFNRYEKVCRYYLLVTEDEQNEFVIDISDIISSNGFKFSFKFRLSNENRKILTIYIDSERNGIEHPCKLYVNTNGYVSLDASLKYPMDWDPTSFKNMLTIALSKTLDFIENHKLIEQKVEEYILKHK